MTPTLHQRAQDAIAEITSAMADLARLYDITGPGATAPLSIRVAYARVNGQTVLEVLEQRLQHLTKVCERNLPQGLRLTRIREAALWGAQHKIPKTTKKVVVRGGKYMKSSPPVDLPQDEYLQLEVVILDEGAPVDPQSLSDLQGLTNHFSSATSGYRAEYMPRHAVVDLLKALGIDPATSGEAL